MRDFLLFYNIFSPERRENMRVRAGLNGSEWTSVDSESARVAESAKESSKAHESVRAYESQQKRMGVTESARVAKSAWDLPKANGSFTLNESESLNSNQLWWQIQQIQTPRERARVTESTRELPRAHESRRKRTRVTEIPRESPRAHDSCRPSESLIRLRSALRLLYNSNTQGKVSFVLFYFVFCLFGIRRSKHLPLYSPAPQQVHVDWIRMGKQVSRAVVCLLWLLWLRQPIIQYTKAKTRSDFKFNQFDVVPSVHGWR